MTKQVQQHWPEMGVAARGSDSLKNEGLDTPPGKPVRPVDTTAEQDKCKMVSGRGN